MPDPLPNLRELLAEYAKRQSRKRSASNNPVVRLWLLQRWQRTDELDGLFILLDQFSLEILTAIGKGLPINGARRVRKALKLDLPEE